MRGRVDATSGEAENEKLNENDHSCSDPSVRRGRRPERTVLGPLIKKLRWWSTTRLSSCTRRRGVGGQDQEEEPGAHLSNTSLMRLSQEKEARKFAQVDIFVGMNKKYMDARVATLLSC